MNYQLLTNNDDLAKVCQQAQRVDQIALDTEFVRTRTYYPQLGLIQLYDGENLSLIDPLPITEWQPFIDLLVNNKVLKFLHAGSEDLEVFLNAFRVLPEPFIDSQILAAFNGRSLSCGFARLVAETLQIELDKSESRTDWMARPLTQKQCNYAADDVRYLLPLARQLIQQTIDAGWISAAQDECNALRRRRRQVLQPERAYLEIGNAWQLRPRQLACLQKLASWRLIEARQRDLAVNFVVREESLWQVARYQPGSLGELEALGVSGPEIRYYGRTLLALVAEAALLTEQQLPAPIAHLVDHPGYKKLFKEIKSLTQTVGEESGLSTELLASRRQINQLINWHWKLQSREHEPELVTGWRGQLLAQRLRQLLEPY